MKKKLDNLFFRPHIALLYFLPATHLHTQTHTERHIHTKHPSHTHTPPSSADKQQSFSLSERFLSCKPCFSRLLSDRTQSDGYLYKLDTRYVKLHDGNKSIQSDSASKVELTIIIAVCSERGVQCISCCSNQSCVAQLKPRWMQSDKTSSLMRIAQLLSGSPPPVIVFFFALQL